MHLNISILLTGFIIQYRHRPKQNVTQQLNLLELH